MSTGSEVEGPGAPENPSTERLGAEDLSAEGGDAGPEWQYRRSDRSSRNGPLRRRYRDFRRRVTAPLIPALVPAILRTIARTWRVRSASGERRKEVLESPDGCIAVLWHGRMAAAAPIFAGVDAVILVSRSGDGNLANMLLSRFGYDTLRGSTGKVGGAALKAMRSALNGGRAIAITPDGPRGPRHRVNRGAAFLARATGRPILPIGFAAGRAARLNSWDRFMIPAPFTKVQVVYGEPIHVPPGATDEDLVTISDSIHASLMAAETAAYGSLGKEVDW